MAEQQAAEIRGRKIMRDIQGVCKRYKYDFVTWMRRKWGMA